ncbi:hypothetical protein D9M72_601660 [compost metagenome]
MQARAFGDGMAFQYLLHEVDAPARAVQLIAEQLVGGAGGGAEAAMHAIADDGFGFLAFGGVTKKIGQVRLHGVGRLCLGLSGPAGSEPGVHALRVEDAGRVEGLFQAAVDRGQRRGQRREHAH